MTETPSLPEPEPTAGVVVATECARRRVLLQRTPGEYTTLTLADLESLLAAASAAGIDRHSPIRIRNGAGAKVRVKAIEVVQNRALPPAPKPAPQEAQGGGPTVTFHEYGGPSPAVLAALAARRLPQGYRR